MQTEREAKMEKEKILLVDDNPTNLQVLFQALDGCGYNLLVAKNGETALDIVQKAHPDLILLDIMMPGIDGYEVCRRLKSDPDTSDIPVIFLSSLQDTADKVKGFQVGAVDYVHKPFQSDEIKARVNTHLTIHQLRLDVESQKGKLENELKVVSELQRRLLPKTLPTIEGLQLSAYYETSLYAGGDYYDIAELPNNRWGFLMADAEGHSAPAAVLMAMTCILFRASEGFLDQPGELIDYLNTHLCKVADPSFMTAIYVVYDANAHNLRVARAGHPHPMIYRASDRKAIWHECDGVAPMGILPYDNVPETDIQLEKGDRLVLYTDGVTERFSQAGELYGEERLLNVLGNSTHTAPSEMLDAIVRDLERFAAGRPADDDQAILIGQVE